MRKEKSKSAYRFSRMRFSQPILALMALIATAVVNASSKNVLAAVDVSLSDQASDGTGISSLTSGTGTGGDITVSGSNVYLANGTTIDSKSFGTGDAGNIAIVADHFVSSADSVLNASSGLGIDVTISFLSPGEEVNSKQVELPVVYLDAIALPAAPDSICSLLSSMADTASLQQQWLANSSAAVEWRLSVNSPETWRLI